MKKYLTVCRKAVESHLLWKFLDISHLIDNIDLYSLQDLVDTESGELLIKLHSVIEYFSNHIKTECEICMGRGHICEICSNDQVLFPFDAANYVCDTCYCVYHKACFQRKSECPKCLRLKQRSEEEQQCNVDFVEFWIKQTIFVYIIINVNFTLFSYVIVCIKRKNIHAIFK